MEITQYNFALLASLVCGNPLDLLKEIHDLEMGGAEGLHFDVMDGRFVPRLGLYPEFLKAVKSVSKLPVDVHLMIERPEDSIDAFIKAGMTSADTLVVHAEATQHLHHVIKRVKDAGIKAGVALNPATPLCVLDYVLPSIDNVTHMAINPGILGHKLIPDMLRKIGDLKQYVAGYPQITITVDGGVNPDSAATMVRMGADMLVCGTSSIYKPPHSLRETVTEFRAHVTADLQSSLVPRALPYHV